MSKQHDKPQKTSISFGNGRMFVSTLKSSSCFILALRKCLALSRGCLSTASHDTADIYEDRRVMNHARKDSYNMIEPIEGNCQDPKGL